MLEPLKIIVCGEGGQGAKSIAEIIAAAAWLEKTRATCIPQFGVEKRGGLTAALTQIGDEEIPYPVFAKADIAVVLSQRSVGRVRKFLKPSTVVVVNSHLVGDVSDLDVRKVYAVDGRQISSEQLGEPKTFNIAMLGATTKFLPKLTVDACVAAIDQRLDQHLEKTPGLRDIYRRAFNLGREQVMPYGGRNEPTVDQERRIVTEGEAAIISRWPGRCKSCGLCVAKCPAKCIAWDEGEPGRVGEPSVKIDAAKCLGCTTCEQICPDFAIKIRRKADK